MASGTAFDHEEPVLVKPSQCCPVCNSTFKDRQSLRSHQTSLGHKIPCTDCAKHFVSLNALNQHIQVAHSYLHSPRVVTSATALSATSATVVPASSPTVVPKDPEKTAISEAGASDTTPLAQSNDQPDNTSKDAEQNALFQSLHAQCHSHTRLTAQGYTMTSIASLGSHSCKGIIRRDLFRHPSPPGADASGCRKGRQAVVIDYKIVQVTRGRWEIAYLGAVDFLTGEVLINRFVAPRGRVTSWDTKNSGITPSAMAAAIESGQALRGWLRARWELWKYVDSDTVLIGHFLNNGLDTLGMIHSRVVDLAILTAEAVFHTLCPAEPLTRIWGLKALAGDLLARKVQGGRKGHGVVEDAITIRDVVIWCLKYPDLLCSWAEKTRTYHDMQEEMKKEGKTKKDKAGRKPDKVKKAK